jgi:hypothetical protein
MILGPWRIGTWANLQLLLRICDLALEHRILARGEASINHSIKRIIMRFAFTKHYMNGLIQKGGRTAIHVSSLCAATPCSWESQFTTLFLSKPIYLSQRSEHQEARSGSKASCAIAWTHKSSRLNIAILPVYFLVYSRGIKLATLRL